MNKKDCPIGTVPIRRMAQEQLQRAKDASLNLADEYLSGNTIGITTYLIILDYTFLLELL